MRLRFAMCAAIATCTQLAAQTTPPPREARAPQAFVHESWTVQDGLPVNSITAVLQSRDGYLWVATFDGLARFDGVRFTVFNSATSPGIPNNRIISLQEARDGTLWLRTEDNQLVRFRDGRFTTFGRDRGITAPVWTILEDKSATIWIGTQRALGVIRNDRFVRVAAASIDTAVLAITQRADGSMWAGVEGRGLFRIEGDRATAAPGQPDMLTRGAIQAMADDSTGTLWLGLHEAGIWRFRERAERVADAGDVLSFSVSPATGIAWGLTPSMIYRMEAGRAAEVQPRVGASYHTPVLVPDESGKMLYSSGPELYRDGRRIYTLPVLSRAAPTISSSITAIIQDREGSIWLGTWGAGLHRLKPATFTVIGAPEGLSADNVYSVYEDRRGTIWVGTLDGGMSRIDGDRVTRVTTSAGNSNTVLSFTEDRRGRLWIGGVGLFECVPTTTQCALASNEVARRSQVRAMDEDSTGALWFGSEAGLLRLDGDQWTTPHVGNLDRQPVVRAFERSRDGALWMATAADGLLRYRDGRFRSVTTADGLPFDRVRSLYIDRDGWLWVGTEGRGLARLDPRDWEEGKRGGRIISLRARDGLFDEVIHTILEDDADRLWMSGNRGIFWVDRRELLEFATGRRQTINSTAYTERDGLRNREANGGSQPAGIKSRDGRLWFATQDGVAVVDPSQIKRNTLPPNVVIEQVRAGGATMRPSRAPLALGVDQRDLEVDYTALSFVAPANMRFRYRLEPYDRAWVEAGNRRTAFYTRVPPGQYTFRVIASNNDGVWNETGATLGLTLAPRFYETGVFRTLAVLSAMILVALGVAWRIRLLRARTVELAHLVDERTSELRQREAQLEIKNSQLEAQAVQLHDLDRTKSRFFANVSHEFRTPLTLILGPLRDLTEERHGKLPAWLQRQIEMMTRNSQRLLRLVNQVLDVAKLESGSLALATKPRDLVELARAITLSFTPLAERRNIRLHFAAEPGPVVVQVDAEQMEKVLANLLSNAFKFTEPGGEIEVSVRREAASAVTQVRDSGIGISADQVPHVFERFYQADSSATRRHEGTGIGLSLVRELAELHGGTVSVESEPGVGSTFRVRLPLDQTAVAEPVTLEPVRLGRTDESAVPRVPALADGGEETDRTTVLVVDDNADVRTYVRSVLEPTYRVLEASDGEQGLSATKEALPDLVVADVMMPKLDGFGMARALKDDPTTDCIPVILLTARADATAEIEGLGTGADDYISKPFHAGVLEARVAALLANRRRLRERFRQEGLPPAQSAAPPVARRSELEVQLRAIIEANLTEPGFNPEALAEGAGLSYQQLYRRLAAEMELTPSQLIRTVRVERAAQLLRDGAGNVVEVAYSVGFNSISHFYACFRERFGTTPGSGIGSVGNREST